ncbi:MAG: DMT family transporter [Ignavibacteriaceae bacterium]
MSERTKIVFGYVLICIIWGTTWLAIRIGLEDLTPVYSSGLRFLTAAILLFIIVKLRRIKLQTDKISMGIYLVQGIFTFLLPFGMIYWGQQYVPSGLASVLFSIYPFLVAIFAKLAFRDERIGAAKVISLILGFTGVFLLFYDKLGLGEIDSALGMGAIALGAAFQAGVVIVIKKFGSHLNVVSMNLVPLTIAAAVMIPLGMMTEETGKVVFTLPAVFSIGYLAIFGTIVTFITYYWLLKKINIILLSLVAFITPIIALIAGWIAYNETLNYLQLTGTIIILASLLLAIKGNKGTG